MKRHLVGHIRRTGGKPENVEIVVDERPLAEITETFTDQDATPSVLTSAQNKLFKTGNTVATTITDFDDGYVGQEIWVVIGDSNTTIDFTSSGLKGNGGADWSPSSGDHMSCVYDGTDWYCSIVSESVTPYSSQIKYLTSDASYTSDTTLADLAGMTGFSIEAGALYAMRGYLKVQAPVTFLFKIRFDCDNTPQSSHVVADVTDSGANQVGDVGLFDADINTPAGGAQDQGCNLSGFVEGHASSAISMDVQGAQASSNGSATIFRKGSWVELIKIS